MTFSPKRLSLPNCLTTPRLTLRPFNQDDLDFLANLHGDAEVSRFLGTGEPRGAEESVSWLLMSLYVQRDYGTGQLVVERQGHGPIGRAGLFPVTIEASPDALPLTINWVYVSKTQPTERTLFYEIGYAFHQEHWGQGYAAEASKAILAHYSDSVPKKRIVSCTRRENLRSIQVAKKLGLVELSEINALGSPAALYDFSEARAELAQLADAE